MSSAQRVVPKVEDVFGDLPALETERLLLRKMRLEDAEDLFEYATDPEVTRYVTWGTHASIDNSRSYLSWMVERYNNGQVSEWGIEHKGDKKFIGTCGFAYWLPHPARAEIGYALSRSYWGQGLMPEAVRQVLAFGFREMMLNRIEARCLVENIASARVLEKVGMTYEGVLRQHEYIKGSYQDLKMYSILRSEWPGP